MSHHPFKRSPMTISTVSNKWYVKFIDGSEGMYFMKSRNDLNLEAGVK